MEIIEIDKEEFNKLKFDRREIYTKQDKELMVASVKKWAERLGAEVVYKYDRKPNGYLWIVEEK